MQPRKEIDVMQHVKLNEFMDFDGDFDPEKVLDWVRSLDRFFEFREYNDEQAFKVAILKLTKFASLWYDNMQQRRKRKGKDKIKSWDKLKKRILEKYVPREFEQELYLKMTNLTQGNLSVQEYIKEFERLTLILM